MICVYFSQASSAHKALCKKWDSAKSAFCSLPIQITATTEQEIKQWAMDMEDAKVQLEHQHFHLECRSQALTKEVLAAQVKIQKLEDQLTKEKAKQAKRFQDWAQNQSSMTPVQQVSIIY